MTVLIQTINVSYYLDGIMQNALHVNLPQRRHRD